jgi:hypothetical protein
MSISNSINCHEEPVAVATADSATSGSNAAVVLTYAAAGASKNNCLGSLQWSYSGGAVTGSLKVEDGSGNTIFFVDITATGPGTINFSPPKKGSANTALIITLGAGGTGVTGKINATQWVEGPGP